MAPRLGAIPFLVTRGSDLALSKAVDVAEVRPGDTVVFTLVTSNLGPSVVTGVVISDRLPTGLQVLEVSIDQGTTGHTNGLVGGVIGALTNGTAVTLSISTLATEMGVFTNRATVASIEGDPILENNEDTVSLVVLADAARTLGIEPGNGPFVIIHWPVSPVPMTLESTAELKFDSVWSTVPNPPGVSQGQNIVTNEVAGERYYRLRGP